MTFRVLGFDPGTKNAGIAVLERVHQGWALLYHIWVRNRNGSNTADARARLISEVLHGGHELHCMCSEKQVGASVGSQERGHWTAGNLGVHEVVGRAKHEAWCRRIPFIELATSTVVKAVTGSGNIRGGVDYARLRRAVQAQVRGMPDKLSEHELMAIAVAIAGARIAGGRE